MKKLLLMFVAIAAVSFASCGNKTKSTNIENDSTSIDSVDTTSIDTTVVDTTVVQ